MGSSPDGALGDAHGKSARGAGNDFSAEPGLTPLWVRSDYGCFHIHRAAQTRREKAGQAYAVLGRAEVFAPPGVPRGTFCQPQTVDSTRCRIEFRLQTAILTIFRATSLVLPHLSRDNRPTFRQSLLTRTPTMAKSLDVSPAKSFAEEVEILRKSFRACLDVYATRVEAELSHIKEATLAKTQSAQLSQNTIRDLRDMITLCRTLDIKPEKGRRKDLKKIDSLIDELNLMVENW
jgi:hypothetical protein